MTKLRVISMRWSPSTLMTSAPRSQRMRLQVGPAYTCDRSSTRTGERGRSGTETSWRMEVGGGKLECVAEAFRPPGAIRPRSVILSASEESGVEVCQLAPRLAEIPRRSRDQEVACASRKDKISIRHCAF